MSDPAARGGGAAGGPAGPGGATVDAARVRSLACPNCGAAVTLRAPTWTHSVACPSCRSVLDARDPNLRVLQRFEQKVHTAPSLPLGSRGQWRGAPYEVIGFQVMQIEVDGVPYSWREYLLFNPYHGFRFLTEYEGHWNDVVALHAVPATGSGAGQEGATVGGRTYRHFQTARARTTQVLGEFPWEVRVGDTVVATDYVDPPRLLSAESSDDEVTWSMGEYVDAHEIWRAFKVPGSIASPRGVFANQPSPYAASGGMWKLFGLFAIALTLLMLLRLVTADSREVHRGHYVFHAPDTTATVFVTPSFDIGGTGNVVVELDTDMSNSWLYVNYALINEGTGVVYDFGREVSYYVGVDSDGGWKEGSPRDRARIGNVAAGRYFLRVESDAPPNGRGVSGTLRVRRDVPSFIPFLLALLVLALPPFFILLQNSSFETRRWAESDHAPVSSDDSDDDSDDE